MIRRILVPLDPSPFAEASLLRGCTIAKAHDAEVTGLVVLDTEGIKDHIDLVKPYQYDYHDCLGKALEQEAHDRIRKLLVRFREVCEAEGVKHREAQRQGSPSRHIIQEAMYYDLLIMGLRTYYEFESTNRPGNSLEIVLDHSVTPILAMPEQPRTRGIKRVLVALNGTLPAARALQHFGKLARPEAYDVTIIMAHENGDEAHHHLNEAEAYLGAHGINVVNKEWTPQNVIPAIEERYLQEAELVVLGAHSKRVLIDFMIGSLSRHLIEQAKIPLLIGL